MEAENVLAAAAALSLALPITGESSISQRREERGEREHARAEDLLATDW